MKLSKVVAYDLDFEGIWHQCSAALLGVFLFLRIVYYLGILGLANCSGSQIWLELIVPVALGIAYIGLMRGVQWNQPLAYGVMGVLFCGLMVLWCIFAGSGFRIVFGLVWYLLAAVSMLGTVTGYISNRLILVAAFAVPVLFRFFAEHTISQVMHLNLAALLPNISILCALAGFACLAPALKGRRLSNS